MHLSADFTSRHIDEDTLASLLSQSQFNASSHIRELLLANNKLHRVPNECCLFVNITRLVLDANRLTAFPLIVERFPVLVHLSISSNEISQLPATLECTQLQTLDLRFNKLVMVEPLRVLTRLSELHLLGNPIAAGVDLARNAVSGNAQELVKAIAHEYGTCESYAKMAALALCVVHKRRPSLVRRDVLRLICSEVLKLRFDSAWTKRHHYSCSVVRWE
jgi:hypothetical protein